MPLARTLYYIIYTTGSIKKTVPAQVGYSCFALDLIFEFARFYAAKEQSVKVTPFMYMHPPNRHPTGLSAFIEMNGGQGKGTKILAYLQIFVQKKWK